MKQALISLLLLALICVPALAEEKAATVPRNDAASFTVTGTITFVSGVAIDEAGNAIREIFIRSNAIPVPLNAGIFCTGAWVAKCGAFRVGKRISVSGVLLPVEVDDSGGSPVFTIIPTKAVGGI